MKCCARVARVLHINEGALKEYIKGKSLDNAIFVEITALADGMKAGSLNDLAAEIHRNAVDHGWWEEERALPEILMLCVSELAEALEEYREGRPMFYCGSTSKDCENLSATGTITFDGKEFPSPCAFCNSENKKPEGVAVELADCVIRILDYCGREGIDIDALISAKHEYNKSRPYRHGGKKC